MEYNTSDKSAAEFDTSMRERNLQLRIKKDHLLEEHAKHIN